MFYKSLLKNVDHASDLVMTVFFFKFKFKIDTYFQELCYYFEICGMGIQFTEFLVCIDFLELFMKENNFIGIFVEQINLFVFIFLF